MRNDDASFSYARSPFDGGRRPCDDGYGHAIHFSQGFSFASEEAGAISEGFGDYWAVTVSDVVARALGVPELEPLPCVADWDSTSYTSLVPHCLRRRAHRELVHEPAVDADHGDDPAVPAAHDRLA